MIDTCSITPIGQSEMLEGQFAIRLKPEYREGLLGLGGFSHAVALWWAHRVDLENLKGRLTVPSPYTSSDNNYGVFATRSEARPNPIGMSVFPIALIDQSSGLLFSYYFDMLPETPILDIKPYFPASDFVTSAKIPDHFRHWPKSQEESANFDWSNEFRH